MYRTGYSYRRRGECGTCLKLTLKRSTDMLGGAMSTVKSIGSGKGKTIASTHQATKKSRIINNTAY